MLNFIIAQFQTMTVLTHFWLSLRCIRPLHRSTLSPTQSDCLSACLLWLCHCDCLLDSLYVCNNCLMSCATAECSCQSINDYIKMLLCTLNICCMYCICAVYVEHLLCVPNLCYVYRISAVRTKSTLYALYLKCIRCACAVCNVTKSSYCHNDVHTLSILLLPM